MATETAKDPLDLYTLLHTEIEEGSMDNNDSLLYEVLRIHQPFRYNFRVTLYLICIKIIQ